MVRMHMTLCGTRCRVGFELGLVGLVLPTARHSGHITALLRHPARGRRMIIISDKFLNLPQGVRRNVLVIDWGSGGVFWQGITTARGVRVTTVVFRTDSGTHTTVPSVLMVRRGRRVTSPYARPDLRQLNRRAVVPDVVF